MYENKENILRIPMGDDVDRSELFGVMDANIKEIEKRTGTSIMYRDGDLLVSGEGAERALRMIRQLNEAVNYGIKLDKQKVSYIIDMAESGQDIEGGSGSKDIICYTHRGKPLIPKTKGQRVYVDMIKNSDMVFGIGPAGTGKTYLACAMAVSALKNKQVDKIILARPAVEAGERLGFLPGDLQEKVDPYLRPIYDVLFEIMGQETATKLREKGVIEIVPLAYMRGRTLDNAFIILDEAQNTTREQMKMFLTRMGFDSKVVVTGDVTQIDLPRGVMSGLVEARRVLKDVEGVEFCTLTALDVVRHELVKRIIKAYSDYDRKNV